MVKVYREFFSTLAGHGWAGRQEKVKCYDEGTWNPPKYNSRIFVQMTNNEKSKSKLVLMLHL